MFFLATLLHAIAQYLPNKWNDDAIVWQFPYYRSLEVEFTRSQFVAAIPGTFFYAWYAAQKHWLPNNILGLALCIQGIEMLSLGSFKTGAILLAGLFVYDIFWVFFTPVMVSVAKSSFDAPIKLLFPSGMVTRPFSMLGIGDIVIPALALRYDVSKGKDNHYFKSAFMGYTVGLVATIIVMNYSTAGFIVHCTRGHWVLGYSLLMEWRCQTASDVDAKYIYLDARHKEHHLLCLRCRNKRS